MTANHLRKALRHLHEVLAPPGAGSLTDGQLVTRFVATRDEGAFAALVRRHGPMVWGVCRRILRHTQDAEDAFQATFLVLARKAGSVANRQAVGSWLYRVSYRIALEAKTLNVRRRAREKQVEDMPQPEVLPDEMQDWRPWLDRELNLLPEIYRAVIVTCDLEGRSRKEAGRLLGLAEGTVSSRLARGRCLLAKRLSRYGLSLSGAALSAVLAEGMASAAPGPLVWVTVKIAAGELSAVAPSVGILMKGALQTMLLAKLKLAVGAVMVVMALGASGLVYRASGQSGPAGKGGGGRPATELDVLKQEIELLKLKLEVVEQKVRSQEDELRALRKDAKGDGKNEAAREAESLQENIRKRQADMKLLRDTLDKSQVRQPQDLKAEPNSSADTKEGRLLELRRGELEGDRSAHQKEGRLLLEKATRRQQLTERDRELLGRQTEPDPLQEAEAALKALREARDSEAQRKEADRLEKSLQKLREQQQKKRDRDHP